MPKISKCDLNEYTIIDYEMTLQREPNKVVKNKIPGRVRDSPDKMTRE